MKIDPVSLEVIHNALLAIVEEMGVSLQKSAYSSNIKTRLDFACAFFDASLRNIVQALHIPSMLGALITTVPSTVQSLGVSHLRPGDGIIMNDPHNGGTHLPDISLTSPVFHDSELFGYVANIAHHQDVGGRSPGSVPGDATDIYQEGLIIPPTKIVQDWTIRKDVFKFLLANVRSPHDRRGDYHAQIAANRLGTKRIKQLIAKYGANNLKVFMDELIGYTERRMRRAIHQIPEGTYYGTDYLDGDGITRRPVTITCKVKIEGDKALIDLSESDKQGPGPMNATWSTTLSAISFIFKCLAEPDIPINHGMYQPLHIIAPKGSVVNARPPAAIAGCWEVGQRICDVLMLAFSKALPHKVCAAGKGIICNISFGGIAPSSRSIYTYYETVGGGYGARPNKDGMDAVQYHLTNTQNAPIEEIEMTYPVLIERYELIPNSEGPGQYRGGFGIRRDYRFKDHRATFSILSDRKRFPPWGLFGGLQAQPSKYIVNPDTKSPVDLWSKQTILLHENDLVSIQTPGGGGYGNPLERDPCLLLDDVKNGKISFQRAQEFYGVIIDPISWQVDWDSTTECRTTRKGR